MFQQSVLGNKVSVAFDAVIFACPGQVVGGFVIGDGDVRAAGQFFKVLFNLVLKKN